MSQAPTSLNVVIIHQEQGHDSGALIEALKRLDGRGDIGLGEIGVVERTQLGGTIHRRAAIEVFTDLEEAMEQQERRRTYRARAAKKLDKLVRNKIRD